jgi:hypothetical protein
MLTRHLAIALLLASATLAHGADTPTTAPTPHTVVIPPGLKMFDIAGRHIIADPADEPWIRQAMTALAPTTRPTTTPADLVEKFAAARPELTKQMTADLALSNPAVLTPFFESTTTRLTKFRDMRLPIYYFAISREALRTLAKSHTWEDPRYYYNRVTDEVMIDTGMRFSIDVPVDDMLLPSLFDAANTSEARAAILTRAVQQTEHMTTTEIATRAQVGLQVSFITFIIDNVFRPMNLKSGQDWFGVGTSGVLSARYAALVTGASEDWILKQMTAEPQRTPFSAASTDLLHPLDLTTLRDQAVPFYLDSVRRKSTTALRSLITQAGTPAVAKIIAAMRATPPADAAALITLIQQQTNIDLKPQLIAQK